MTRKRIPIVRKDAPVLEVKKKQFAGSTTVAQRIYNYCKFSKKRPTVTLLMKQEIGNIVKDIFFNTPDKKNKGAYTKIVREREGFFKVLVYPQYFVRVIDAIIFSYFNEKK